MPAVALTDHGSLSGAVQFYRAAKDVGVKPIIGLELYVVSDRHGRAGMKERYAHLTMLARDDEGYANLIKIATAAYLEGYYYKPRADWELLGRHNARADLPDRLHERPGVAAAARGQRRRGARRDRAPDRAVRPRQRLRRAAGRRHRRAARARPQARPARPPGRPEDGGHQRRPLPATRRRPRPGRPGLHPDAVPVRRAQGAAAHEHRRVLPEERRRDARAVRRLPRGLRRDPRDRRALQRRDPVRPHPPAALPGARRSQRRRVTCASCARPASAAATAPTRGPRCASAWPSSSTRSATWASAPTSSSSGTSSSSPRTPASPSVPAAARRPAASSPTRWASPTSTRSSTTCCSSAFSTPAASRCPTSTWTSRSSAATRSSTTSPASTAATTSPRSSPSAPWRRGPPRETRPASSACPTRSATASPR